VVATEPTTLSRPEVPMDLVVVAIMLALAVAAFLWLGFIEKA